MHKRCTYFHVLIFILISSKLSSQKINQLASEPMSTLMNINKISMWVRPDGRLNRVFHGSVGMVYPKGTAGVVYQDGMLWGGIVHDGKVVQFEDQDYMIRVGGSRYRSSLQPGRIITKGVAEAPDNPDVRIWRIRRDWQDADLTQDAAEYFSVSMDNVTQEQIDEVRWQYEEDWHGWPWEKGAPFYDDNGSGIMDAGEEPGLAYADQVVWYVANDLDYDLCYACYSLLPIGMEMQVTLWAYNRPTTGQNAVLNAILQHVIFKRVRLIYKGCMDTPDTARIDSMYIGQWSDVDLGSAFDDLVGCDTTLDLGFVYNANGMDDHFTEYGLLPPSFGYTILQGPLVYAPGNEAQFDFRKKPDYKNLSMTSFTYEAPGDPFSEPTTLKGYYYMLQGYDYNASYDRKTLYPHPPGVEPTFFPLSGDPVSGMGHIDGLGASYSFTPNDKRFTCSSGPFSMAIGDTQEVLIAIVGGLGSDRLASVSVMKHYVKWVRSWAQHVFTKGLEDVPPDVPEDEEPVPQDFHLYPNYPNPFNSGTSIEYHLPLQKYVRLSIYNALGQSVKVLVDENQEPGYYEYRWDGTDDRGEKVSSGLYLLRIEAGYWVLTRKMMLLQ